MRSCVKSRSDRAKTRSLRGFDNFADVQVAAGENVVFLSNHQSEGDPQVPRAPGPFQVAKLRTERRKF